MAHLFGERSKAHQSLSRLGKSPRGLPPVWAFLEGDRRQFSLQDNKAAHFTFVLLLFFTTAAGRFPSSPCCFLCHLTFGCGADPRVPGGAALSSSFLPTFSPLLHRGETYELLVKYRAFLTARFRSWQQVSSKMTKRRERWPAALHLWIARPSP